MRTAVDNAASWQTRVPYSARSAGTVRRWLTGVAAEVGDALLADLCAVSTELIGNAVRHASPLAGDELSVRFRLTTGSIEFAVTDGGSASSPAVRSVDQSSPDGRGLHIVDALTSQWGVTDDGDGRTVWVRFDR
ncbi:ATP-binding protein [Stackebrandtia soli]|uniref:ATP-binding protein n=1 Tax=Stackebrandtia soli TaxID=1892856 RepID=UPI0039EA2D58